MSSRIAPGVVQIDTLLGGWGEVTAGYVVEGPEPCLVETGSQSSLPTVLAELDAMGLGPADLATVVVTHIHLDHAGGVGDIAAAFPGRRCSSTRRALAIWSTPIAWSARPRSCTASCSTRSTAG